MRAAAAILIALLLASCVSTYVVERPALGVVENAAADTVAMDVIGSPEGVFQATEAVLAERGEITGRWPEEGRIEARPAEDAPAAPTAAPENEARNEPTTTERLFRIYVFPQAGLVRVRVRALGTEPPDLDGAREIAEAIVDRD